MGCYPRFDERLKELNELSKKRKKVGMVRFICKYHKHCKIYHEDKDLCNIHAIKELCQYYRVYDDLDRKLGKSDK